MPETLYTRSRIGRYTGSKTSPLFATGGVAAGCVTIVILQSALRSQANAERYTALQHAARDLRCQLIERVGSVVESRGVHEAGHAPHDGRILVLNDDVSAGVANVLRSEHAIRPHAGHHYSENVCSVGRRY